jgi:hypothetical protein
MRGQTPFERARFNEILDLANEYVSTLDYWYTFRSALFPKTIPEATQTIKKYLRVRLRKIDECLADRDMRFFDDEGGSEGSMQFITIAECVLFSVLQYAKGGYGRDLMEDFPKLAGIFERFGKRESAKVEGGRPEEMLKKFWVWAEGPY